MTHVVIDVEVGSYSQLLAAGGAFAALMKEAQVRRGMLLACQSLETPLIFRNSSRAVAVVMQEKNSWGCGMHASL